VSEASYAHCETLIRDEDPDRYFATLFAPAPSRPHIFALYAFSHEVAKVREAVSQSLAGEIRLQWWRDAIEGGAAGDAQANPVAAALEDTVRRFKLPRQALVDLIDARVHDLYEDPIETLNDLEGYCGETSSALFRMASLVLAGGDEPGGAEAAGHAGVAYGMTGLLRALPWHARRGQLYVPPLDILGHHGLDRESVVSGREGEALRAALAEMRERVRHHLEESARLLPQADARIAPAFLPLALVPLYLRELERRDYAPFRSVVDVPRWRKLWALWWRARRG
jgi:15-cis-phytoene synthase